MITNKQILIAGSAALTDAFRDWLMRIESTQPTLAPLSQSLFDAIAGSLEVCQFNGFTVRTHT